MTDWAQVDPAVMTAKFDAFVAGWCQLVARRLYPPDRLVRSMALRVDVLDRQLELIKAAKEN